MSDDSGARLRGPRQTRFRLPKVIDIEIRRTRFEAPGHRNFESSLPSRDDAVEFIVRTDRPIPVRALGPALYVGSTAVTEVTETGPNTYRFIALAPERLDDDADIRLGWTGQSPEEKGDPVFRYRM